MTAIPSQHNIIAFKFYLIKTTRRLFGIRKMLRFIFGLLTVPFTKRNRSAYRCMGACTTNIDGNKIIWKHPDVRFIDEIFCNKCHIPNEDYQLKDSYVVVDAGANIGTFILLAASNLKSGIVYAIEPDKKDFKRLNENVEANNFQNITTINAALTDVVGIISFSNSHVQSTNFHTTKIPHYTHDGTSESLAVTELMKRYEMSRIDFMKIDIEGSEFQIFREPKWLDNVKIISMELHDSLESERVKEIINILRTRNFVVKIVQGTNELYCYAKRN